MNSYDGFVIRVWIGGRDNFGMPVDVAQMFTERNYYSDDYNHINKVSVAWLASNPHSTEIPDEYRVYQGKVLMTIYAGEDVDKYTDRIKKFVNDFGTIGRVELLHNGEKKSVVELLKFIL